MKKMMTREFAPDILLIPSLERSSAIRDRILAKTSEERRLLYPEISETPFKLKFSQLFRIFNELYRILLDSIHGF